MTESLDQQTVAPQTDSDKARWTNILDVGSGLGLAVGSVASLLSQNIAAAALPISLAVALHVANRRRLATEVIENNALAHTAIEQLAQHMQRTQAQIAEQFQANQQQTHQQFNQHRQERIESVNTLSGHIDQLRELIAGLDQNDQELGGFTQSLEAQQQKLAAMLDELRQIDNCSQAIATSTNAVELFYQRGISHQKLGDRSEAIADFTEVLKRDLGHAKAYHQRGLIHAEMGMRKQAVEDLRLAAKYYFEQGDLDNYQLTRDLSKAYYEVRQNGELPDHTFPTAAADEEQGPGSLPLSAPEPVSVGGLFS